MLAASLLLIVTACSGGNELDFVCRAQWPDFEIGTLSICQIHRDGSATASWVWYQAQGPIVWPKRLPMDRSISYERGNSEQ